VVLEVTFVLTALALLAVMAVKQHTCLIETQADPLGGLPASGIAAQCTSQFQQHVQGSLVAVGAVASLVGPAVAGWPIRCIVSG
jgi:hypothetical protein